jgi:hypothetical protein
MGKKLLNVGKRKVEDVEEIKAFAYDMLVSMVFVTSEYNKVERIKFRKERINKFIIAIQLFERKKSDKGDEVYNKFVHTMQDYYDNVIAKDKFKHENKRLKDNLRKRQDYKLNKKQKKHNKKSRK